jgi:hypothetical protein
VIGSSSNIIINRTDNNTTINTGGDKNTNTIGSNMIINQKQQRKATSTTLSTNDRYEIEQENCPQIQTSPTPVQMISQSLPPLPSGNLPTANNLMLTRPPLKKKRNK